MRKRFKKVISILLVAMLAISTGQFGQVAKAAETTGDNVVLSQDFEDGKLGGWGQLWNWSTEKTTVVSDVYAQGNNVLKFGDRASKDDKPGIVLTDYMQSGKIYDVSLKVRLGSGSDSVHIASKVNSPLLGENIYPWMMGDKTVTSSDWTTFEAKAFEVPDQTSELIIYVETNNSAADLFIDEVLIKEVTPVIAPVAVLSQSFEDGKLGGWGEVWSWSTEKTTVVSDVYAQENKVLKFGDRRSKDDKPGIVLTDYMKSGKIYDVSLKIRLGSGSDSVHIASKVNSPLLGENIYPWMMGDKTVTSSDWTTFEAKAFEVPDQTSELIIYVETNNSNADIYIDEVSILDVTPGTTPDEGDLDQTGIKADFEDGLGDWKIRFPDTGSIESITEANHTTGGSKSVAASVNSEYNGPILDVMGKMHKGHKYHLSAWVRMAPGQTPTVLRISVQLGSSSYANVSANVTATDEEWVELSGDLTIATTPSVLNAYVETVGKPAETATYYVDDFEISYIGSVVTKPVQTDLTPIKEAYKDDFLIGSAISDPDFEGQRLQLLKQHHNVVTTENLMKPDYAYDENKEFNFDEENALVAKVQKEGLQLVGHVLVWHSQMPTWLSTAEDGTTPLAEDVAHQNLRTHIRKVIENYGDKVISWDVVNEAIRDDLTAKVTTKNWKTGLRKSPWYNALGPDYVEESFLIAKEVLNEHGWNDVKLYYNDYNDDDQLKASVIYSMVKDINDRYAKDHNGDLLIDGIGMQSHYNSGTNVDNVRLSLEQFSSLGVEISVTELDVTFGSNGKLTEDQANAQGYLYAQLFKLYKEYAKSIKRVTLWGLIDSTSWRKEGSPLLFDESFQAKPAYYAIMDPDKFIAEHPPKEKVTKQAKALFGKPVIDGKLDSVWRSVYGMEVNQYQSELKGATGVAKALWDEKNLYVLVEVQDDKLDKSSANAWEQDSVEIFVDQNNGKTSSYEEGNDGQYRVNFDNEVTISPASLAEGFESATSISGTNYTVEVKIPLKAITPAKGKKIGFDIQINDAKNGSRQSAAAWSDATGSGYKDTSVYGELTLVKEINSGGTGGSGSTGGKGSSGGTGSNGGAVTTGGTSTTGGTVSSNAVTVQATVDSNGKSTAKVNETAFTEAIKNVKDGTVKIDVTNTEKAKDVVVTLAASLVKSTTDVKKIEINAGLASVELPVSLFADAKADAEISLQVIKVDTTSLSEEVRNKVGKNVVFDFNLSVGGEKISNFGAKQKVQVSYPYTLEAGVKPGKVVVYYIADNGKLEVVKNGHYKNGAVQFKAKHFSKYAAIPVEVNLKDIGETSWAVESIEALAAREIIKGVTKDTFLPKKEVTRAEFVQMLVQTFDLTSQGAANPFSDVKAGDWYQKAVITAYELGVVKGKSDGSFGVNEKISRQDMAVMTLSAIKAAGITLTNTSEAANFKDSSTISQYAKESVAAMQKAGVINGMPDGGFAPKDTANRAQAAVILNKLLGEL